MTDITVDDPDITSTPIDDDVTAPASDAHSGTSVPSFAGTSVPSSTFASARHDAQYERYNGVDVSGQNSVPDATEHARTSGTNGRPAPENPDNTPHNTTVDATGKADRIRAACELVGRADVSPREIRTLLADQGDTVSPDYVSRVVRKWKDELTTPLRNRSDAGGRNERTADLPRLTDRELARMEAELASLSRSPAPDSDAGPVASSARHDAQYDRYNDVEVSGQNRDPDTTKRVRTSGTNGRPASENPDNTPHDTTGVPASPLAAEVAAAAERVRWQHAPELMAAWSEDERAAERELVEWERATDRTIRRAGKQAELSRLERDRKEADALADSARRDARWHRRALAARRRVASADARVAGLHRTAELSARALVGVVILGMIWSGVNVQHNLVPDGNMANPLYWLSFGLEAMISVPIIVIMVVATTAARLGRELNRGRVILAEVGLMALTVSLNAGPHLFAHHITTHLDGRIITQILPAQPGTAAEYAIAPIMVGVVIWLHAWTSARYAELINTTAASITSEENRS